jgi:hypothetical protein
MLSFPRRLFGSREVEMAMGYLKINPSLTGMSKSLFVHFSEIRSTLEPA